MFMATTVFAFLAVGLADGLYLMAAIASSLGSTPDRAKKHTCITVLMRFRMPGFTRHLVSVDGVDLQPLVDDVLLNRLLGQPRIQISWGSSKGELIRKVPPGLAPFEKIQLLQEFPLVAGDKVGAVNQVGGADRILAQTAGATP
jgi:hypothetical protein